MQLLLNQLSCCWSLHARLADASAAVQRLSRMIFRALEGSNQAAIISKGWGQLGVIEVCAWIIVLCAALCATRTWCRPRQLQVRSWACKRVPCRGRSRLSACCWWTRCRMTGSSHACVLWCTTAAQAPLRPASWRPAPPPSCPSLATSPSGGYHAAGCGALPGRAGHPHSLAGPGALPQSKLPLPRNL